MNASRPSSYSLLGSALDLHDLKIRRLKEYEERAEKGTLPHIMKKAVRYSYFEVHAPNQQEIRYWVIAKSQQQVEELAERLKNEVFSVSLPVLSVPKSPRAQNSTAFEDYLEALSEKGEALEASRSFCSFLTSNVAPPDRSPFWSNSVRKKGFLWKKKGDRSKLQMRFCVIKWGTLFYFKQEGDINPAGSIRLDLVEVEFYKAPDSDKVGFSLSGGRKAHPRIFLSDTQADCDRWVAEVRAVKTAHEKAFNVTNASLKVNVSEGRNLAASTCYCSVIAEAQQSATSVALKTHNPTWSAEMFAFEISSNKKFLNLIVWDAPTVAALTSPTCVGEISIPLGEYKSGSCVDLWIPLCPQNFFQSAAGEIHVRFEYVYERDQRSLQEQQQAISFALSTISLVIEHFLQHEDLMKVEGLFRVPGRLTSVQMLWDISSRGERPSFVDVDAHDVGGLLKTCLRNLLVPLVPFVSFEKVVALDVEDKSLISKLRDILSADSTPQAMDVMRQLLKFLNKVSKYEMNNRMNQANLAMVFGPAILRDEEESLAALHLLPKINGITKKMIEKCNEL